MSLAWQLIVFDWDGTLSDSADDLVGSLQVLIQEIGLPERSPARIRQHARAGIREVFVRLFPELDTSHVLESVRRYHRRHGWPRSRPRLLDGALEALRNLRQQGFELAIATGKSRHGLEYAMHATGCHDLFVVTRCANESAPKPAADMLEHIMLRTATGPESVLMVGDTEYDMLMAGMAGVSALGVRSGVHAESQLRLAGAVDVIDSVAALPAWLNAVGRLSFPEKGSGQGESGSGEQATEADQR